MQLKGQKLQTPSALDPQIIERSSAKFVCPLVLAETGQADPERERKRHVVGAKCVSDAELGALNTLVNPHNHLAR